MTREEIDKGYAKLFDHHGRGLLLKSFSMSPIAAKNEKRSAAEERLQCVVNGEHMAEQMTAWQELMTATAEYFANAYDPPRPLPVKVPPIAAPVKAPGLAPIPLPRPALPLKG